MLLVGEAANRRGTLEPDRLARGFKRRLGDEAPLLLGEEEMSPQELTGHVIRWVVDKVAEREGRRPAHVTLTCPATWGDFRRQLMTEAAAAAQLTDVGLLPEPVAAAAYYASQQRLDPGALVAIYDLGGGTFDASVVAKTGTGFEIRGTPGGDETIGGADFDQVVMDHVAATLRLAWATLDTADPVVLAGLAQVRANAIEAKEALSTDTDATVPVILPDLSRDVRLTRGEFEAAIRIPVLRTIDTLAQTIDAAGVQPADLEAVLLVGGSSRIPLVSRLLASELGVAVALDAHPKYAVCLGAAISAAPRLADQAPPAGTAPSRGAAPSPRTPLPPAPAAGGRPAPGTVGGAGRRPAEPAGAGAELLAPAPAVDVDPADAGIRTPVDVPLRPVSDATRPVRELTDQDQPLTVTHTGDPGRGRRVALLVSAAVVAVLAAATLLAVTAGHQRRQPTPATVAPSTPQQSITTPSGPTATLRAQPVPGAAGAVMHDLATGRAGTLVAVGEAVTDGVPRAWRYESGHWSTVPGPSSSTELRGSMNGIATGSTAAAGFLAVGWTAPRTNPAPPEPTGRPRSGRPPTAETGSGCGRARSSVSCSTSPPGLAEASWRPAWTGPTIPTRGTGHCSPPATATSGTGSR